MDGKNLEFPIYNSQGTPLEGCVLRKATYESSAMSLGDRITGDVIYNDNMLALNMDEYILYEGVKFFIVNPPTIVREGLVSDNGDLKGMTKYSFEFYHPMYILSNLPFSDVAVSVDEKRYLSESRNFYWIGKIADFITKLNKNLENTEWIVTLSSSVDAEKREELSEVLSFDNNTIADALKTSYDTWNLPYTISSINNGDEHYSSGKRFLITIGEPSNEIPYTFRFGQGLGLKNNSATPKNNKIITRIAGYGSEDNIPFGYPQIIWTGDQSWDNTENDPTSERGYPIIDGIVGGRYVRLIKHPFTRTHLMPSVFVERVNKKVNRYATGYDPDIELIDYYDADDASIYHNLINPLSPSFETHEFEKIKPEFDADREKSLINVWPDKKITIKPTYLSMGEFVAQIQEYRDTSTSQAQRDMYVSILYAAAECIVAFREGVDKMSWSGESSTDYVYKWTLRLDGYLSYFELEDELGDYQKTMFMTDNIPQGWNDAMNDDGEYEQSYFNIKLPVLGFDLYACAAITQEMKINMRSGACLGCTFTIQCDWDDYKKNFYDADGKFAPSGQSSRRDFTKYPDSSNEQISVIVQKDLETFGTLMPNIYQKPDVGDLFVILGISLPQEYVTDAQERLDAEMKKYMLENNVYYFEYPLKFDEHFLANHSSILNQIKPNSVLRFVFGNSEHTLFVQQISIKYGYAPLPQYDITLTDGIEVSLNQIGQTIENVNVIGTDVANLRQDYESYKGDAKADKTILERYSEMSDYVQRAFSQSTDIYGGLILTSLIALRDENGDIQSGISGLCYNGTDIAAWFGGAKIDKEATHQTPQTNYAKSLFRFDGSGYVAGGNISWDVYGNTKIAGLIKKESGYEYPDGTTTNDLPLGVLTTALTPSSDRTIEAKNATIKNLKLERALVRGFVLRDYFDITPDNFLTLPRVGVNALNVYDLGTVIRVKGTADEWGTILGGGNLLIFLPYVPATDYDEWPNNSQQNLESISAKNQTIYDQCRNLDGQVVSFCNLSEISFDLVAEGSSQYVSANIGTVVPNHSTTLKMALGVGYLSVHTTERAEVLTWEFVNDSNIWTASDTP